MVEGSGLEVLGEDLLTTGQSITTTHLRIMADRLVLRDLRFEEA